MRYYWYTCLIAVIAHGTLKSCGSGRLKQWPCLVNLVIYATLALRIARVYRNTFTKSMVGCRSVGTQCCVCNLCVRMSWLAAKCDTMSATTAPFSGTPAWIGKGNLWPSFAAVVGAQFAPDGFGWKRCGLCTWQVSNASICSVLVALYMCLVFVSNYVRTSIIRFRTSHLFVLTVLSFYILLIN